MFALVRITDSSRTSRHFRKVPIATSRRCAPSPIDKRQRASARPQGSLTPSIVLVLFWPCDLKNGTACIVISSFRFLPWLSPWLLSPQPVPWPYLPSPWPSPLPCRPWLSPWLPSPQPVPWPYLPSPWPSPLPCRPWLSPWLPSPQPVPWPYLPSPWPSSLPCR